MRSAVELGGGATVVSELVVAAYLAAGRLVQVPFAIPERAFLLLRHKERYRTKASLAFEAILTALPPEQPGPPTPPARS